MTLRQYLIHLWAWFLIFPRWSKDEHATIGEAGSGRYKCMLCDYEETDEE